MIRLVPWKRGKGWEIDIRLRGPSGEKIRERVKSPVTSRSGSLRYAQRLEGILLARALAGPEARKSAPPPAPTLQEFAKRFLDEHAVANRQKPSGIAAKRTILTNHLVPLLGTKRLDAIGDADVQRVKVALGALRPKTVNNVLSVLHTVLRKAVEWKVMAGAIPSASLLDCDEDEPEFWDFEEAERLLAAAREAGERELVVVLLGMKAGLRCGEIMALAWTDVDLGRERLTVRSSEWKGQLTATKSRRIRRVPLTSYLVAALAAHRHLRSGRVLAQDDGSPLTQKIVRTIVQRIERRAGLRALGVHALRHTFCSHLAMKGVPIAAIRAWAGHSSVKTTMRYIHLSPEAEERGIRVLDPVRPGRAEGDSRERKG